MKPPFALLLSPLVVAGLALLTVGLVALLLVRQLSGWGVPSEHERKLT